LRGDTKEKNVKHSAEKLTGDAEGPLGDQADREKKQVTRDSRRGHSITLRREALKDGRIGRGGPVIGSTERSWTNDG